MPDEPTTMQDQSPLGQAQDSVHKARRAVAQSLSHTSDRMLEQASQALAKARNAVEQLESHSNPLACDEVRAELSTVETDYRSAETNREHP